jgi:hypothetical protein
MSAKQLIYYFGDDEAYFRALLGEFRKHAKLEIEFKRIFEKSEAKIQSLFVMAFKDKPSCVFVDFSKQTPDYLHLARLISRTPFEHEILTVGLVDYLSPPEVLKESIATGANLNFIKSAETFDVVYSVSKLIAPQSVGEHGFANASLKEEYEAGILCKIGYVHNKGIHIETDRKLSKGDRVVLNHHWLEKKVVPSKHFFVKEVATSNMFYQFEYNADLDFLFIDDFIPPEDMEEDQVQEKQNERDEKISFHKKQIKRWLDENLDSSQEKKAKILVVDHEFHFYQNQARTDKHPYTIRCLPFFTDMEKELSRLQPQVIAYELEDGENSQNSLEGLRKLSGVLASVFPNLKPFIIVFNSQMTSEDMQAALQYNKAIVHTEELSPDLLVKLADALQKKMIESAGNVVSKKGDNLNVFIKKTHPSSIAEMLETVTIIKLSETDMILQSDYPFAPGTNLHFTKPVEMFVNVRPVEKPSGKVPEFYGLIHSLGETEKKALRQYVNSIFFRDHDAKLNEEVTTFKNLNEFKLNEKNLAAQKAAESEAKAKEEKANKEIEKALKAKEAKEAIEKTNDSEPE